MSCYGCGSSFGAFKKEHGCKQCGFAFCNKCLPSKIAIPKLNNEKHRVCMKCYNILTGKVKPKEETGRYSPPENYKKRMALLEERESRGGGGVTAPKGHTGAKRSVQKYSGLAKEDRELQERFDKLREKTAEEKAAGQVTVAELEDRLARVQGLDPSRYNRQKPAYQPPKRSTQQEEVNDLLDEISNEVALDSQLPDPVQEISARLAKLREPDMDDTPASEADKNNLNKPSLRDSQTFSQNISSPTATAGNVAGSQQGSTPAVKKQGTEEKDDVSMEEVGRILNEAAQELEHDAQRALKGLEEDKEIMRKLQEIKQRRKQSSSDVNKDQKFDDSDTENEGDDDDDNKVAADIIRKAIEESKLDEAAAKDGIDVGGLGAGKKTNDTEEWYDPDELPYCCICTEDAELRCLGCDHDLYCNTCFREGHGEFDMMDHVTIRYIPPKGVT